MTAFDLTLRSVRAALAGVGPSAMDDDDALDRYSRTVWSAITEPGDGVAGAMVALEGAVGALRRVIVDAPGSAALPPGEYRKALDRWGPRLVQPAIDASLRTADRRDVRLVTPSDRCWPVQLDYLGAHAPLALWVRGDPAVLARLRPSVAIVGARAATSYGDHVAMELAADLAGSGIPVISGAAYGIDGSAHRAALQVGGTTVALLAGGADKAYPAGNADVIDRIAATGAVVSEVPCGSAPTKWRFLQRNRLIAAMADATVVVEAGWRSGSLNTAGHAAALSRGLGAVPGPITSAASAGCHRMLREFGAQCITSAADVRELLGLSDRMPQLDFGDERPATDDAMRVRDALSARSWRSGVDIARRSGMAVGEVEARLGLLHLEGAVERGSTGWRLVAG